MSSIGAALVQSKVNGDRDRSNLISFSSRLHGGRALVQDVWSIFKYDLCQIIFGSKFIDPPQCGQPARRLYQPWARLYELPTSQMGYRRR